MEDPPARLLSPAYKKAKVDQAERRLRSIKAQAAAWDNAAQAQINDVQANEGDARAELEAKVQSAEKAVEEAQEYLQICLTELGARKTIGAQAIRMAEAKRDERRASADRKIQAAQESLDKARQEMTHDGSSPGESG